MVVKKRLIVCTIATVLLMGCSSMKDTKESEKWTTIEAKQGGVGTVIETGVGYSMDLAKYELMEEFKEFDFKITDINGTVNIKMDSAHFFEKSEYRIKYGHTKTLDSLLEILNKVESDDYFIKVSGHTDNSGELKYNLSISESRAKEIAYYLFINKVGSKSIDYKGFADSQPISSNETETGRSENRRIEIDIIPMSSVK